MKYKWLLPVAKSAGIAALGALGMIGVQNTIPAVKQAATATPQIIQVTADCPDFKVVLPKR